MSPMNFTFQEIRNQYAEIIDAGYEVITLQQYHAAKTSSEKGTLDSRKLLVNRVDIDLSVKKTERLLTIFNDLGIKCSFFLRLHAPEYNPFSFENYRIIRKIVDSGHELGYHSEVIDQSVIWDENATDCLKRDLDVMNKMFNIEVKGVASHGGMTGLNNLDFWTDKRPSDFGLLYEAYDTQPEFNLFNESFYISDSEWVRWKCYDKGKLVSGDNRWPVEHLINNHDLVYLLIHPDTYYDRHFYE
jgi:hypothetical protein